MEARAILRDDMPGGRFVVELPGGVVVQSPTADGLKQQLASLRASHMPAVYKSWLAQERAPVQHRDSNGTHLYTDRGTRLSFDREFVSDDEILAALNHAADKYGQPLSLTGECKVFTARMARVATMHDIEIHNPELQNLIAGIKAQRSAGKVLEFPRLRPFG